MEVNSYLRKDDLYLRRLLPRWAELTRALGGEQEILDRFDITPERTLQSMHAGIPERRPFVHPSMDRVPTAQHVHRKRFDRRSGLTCAAEQTHARFDSHPCF